MRQRGSIPYSMSTAVRRTFSICKTPGLDQGMAPWLRKLLAWLRDHSKSGSDRLITISRLQTIQQHKGWKMEPNAIEDVPDFGVTAPQAPPTGRNDEEIKEKKKKSK